MVKYIIILFLFMISSQIKANDNYITNSKYTFVSGNIDIEFLEKRNGIYYVNGKNSLFNGAITEYFKNKNVKEINIYKNGKLDGIVKKYYNNGKIKELITYQNGNKNGLQKLFYKNGQIKQETEYKNNKKENLEKKFSETGKLIQEKLYNNNKAIKEKIFK